LEKLKHVRKIVAALWKQIPRAKIQEPRSKIKDQNLSTVP
jgi:hypothetical protein